MTHEIGKKHPPNKTIKSIPNFLRAQAETLVVWEEWEATWSSSLNVHLIYIVGPELMQGTKKKKTNMIQVREWLPCGSK